MSQGSTWSEQAAHDRPHALGRGVRRGGAVFVPPPPPAAPSPPPRLPTPPVAPGCKETQMSNFGRIRVPKVKLYNGTWSELTLDQKGFSPLLEEYHYMLGANVVGHADRRVELTVVAMQPRYVNISVIEPDGDEHRISEEQDTGAAPAPLSLRRSQRSSSESLVRGASGWVGAIATRSPAQALSQRCARGVRLRGHRLTASRC